MVLIGPFNHCVFYSVSDNKYLKTSKRLIKLIFNRLPGINNMFYCSNGFSMGKF